MNHRSITPRPWGHVSLLVALALVVSNCAIFGDVGRWDGDLGAVDLVLRDESDEIPLPVEASLTDLLAIALDRRADLDAAEAEVAAAWGRARQAGLWPNPEFEWEAEEIGSKEPDAEEFTYAIAQPIALGGRLRAGRQAGLREHRASMWALASLHRDVAAEVAEGLAEHLGAQARLDLAHAQLATAREIHELAVARRETGRGSDLEIVRAGVSLAEAEIELAVAEREVQTALQSLARVVGLSPDELPTVSEDLSPPPPLPPEHHLLNRVYDDHPLVAQRRAEIEQAGWSLRQVRRERIPDITVGVGFVDRESGDDLVEFSAGVPLPIFDRNQGAIAEARANLRAAEAELVTTRQELLRDLGETYGRYAAALVPLNRLDAEIIPSATRAEAMALEGYRIGTFTQLDVLEARTTLNELRGRRIEALVELLTAHSAVSSLMGLSPSSTETEETEQ